MSLPTFDYPDSPRIAGDAHDDDATQIDNLVEQEAEPPTAKEMPKETREEEQVTIPRQDRLICGSMRIDATWAGATMLLPADPLRKTVTIYRMDPSGDDQALLAGTSDDAVNAQTAVRMSGVTNTVLVLDGYTGAIWVKFVSGFYGAANFSWVAVTK